MTEGDTVGAIVVGLDEGVFVGYCVGLVVVGVGVVGIGVEDSSSASITVSSG